VTTTHPAADTSWRQFDTPAEREAFHAAQDRLDEGADGRVPEQVAANERTVERYDRLVLQPASDVQAARDGLHHTEAIEMEPEQ
jgi:hypothetical protein